MPPRPAPPKPPHVLYAVCDGDDMVFAYTTVAGAKKYLQFSNTQTRIVRYAPIPPKPRKPSRSEGSR